MRKCKLLIIGAGGGREHAVAWKIAQSPRAGELFFARGNAGTAKLGKNLDIKDTDVSGLLEFARNEKIDLTLVVADDAMAAGMVDEFQKAGLRIWGPTRAAAQLEWSKAFSKEFMKRNGLPTAKFETFKDFNKAKEYVESHNLPIVVKASGLALGKGVVIAQTKDEAVKTLEDFMVKKTFGPSGEEVVIEEFMTGPEISIHAFCDGKNYKMFPASQDHKKIGEGDTGPNTGGIGTITPLPFVDEELMKTIEEAIVRPTIEAMAKEDRPYIGVLYPGLMLTKDGPKLLEYNSRFGDPEAQIYMRLLENDLLDIIEASIYGKLDQMEIKWSENAACNIVLCSGGYPGEYEKGKMISGIADAEKTEGVVVFYAGTKLTEDGKVLTNGGRVLGISATGSNLKKALDTAYTAVSKINFEGMQYRRDIGKKALGMIK